MNHPRPPLGGTTRAAVLLGLAVTLATAAGAQLRPGDAVFGGNPLTVISRDGTFTTLSAFASPLEATAMTQAPGNDGLLVAFNAFPAQPFLAVVTAAGVQRTLHRSWTLPTPWEVMVDTDGKVVVVGTTVYGQSGFGHLRPDGSFKLVYEAALVAASQGQPLRATLDPHSGHVLCVNPHGRVFQIEREDPIHITTLASSSAFIWPGGIRPHSDASKLLVEGLRGDFYAVDRATGAKTRIYTAGPEVDQVVAWDVDPYLDALVVYRTEQGGIRSLVRIDLGSGISTVVRAAATGPEIRPMALWGTRILAHADGTPTPGSTVTLRVSNPDAPRATYVMAASFAPSPGFVWRGRHIPLLVHPLIPLSLITPSIFEGFTGALDPSGEAHPRLHLPPGTGGIRIFLAVLVMKGATIHAVSKPFGLSIRAPE